MTQAARVFVTGISGSGKTTGAWHWYLAKAPRVLIVDQVGEWNGRVFQTANTLPELYAAITEARKEKRWVISYSNMDNRLHDLIRWLLPLPNVDQSPVLAMGGIVLLLDEVDLIAPTGGAPEVIRNLYRRSRHVRLSIVSVTQRPANVLREVSAQSTQVLAYRLTEPRDLDYLSDLMRWDQEQVGQFVRWTRRHVHGAVWRDLVSGSTLWIPDRGKPLTDPGERHSSPTAQRIPQERQQQLPGRETATTSVGSPESLKNHSAGGGGAANDSAGESIAPNQPVPQGPPETKS
jgi:hypothetical protein